jgi:DNA-binding XRE family transcriptional regulator
MKTNKIKNGRIKREQCKSCGQLIPLPKQSQLKTPDVNRMKRIMKKHGFSQIQLANEIGVSQGTVSGWFTNKRNLQGKIKSLYFKILKNKNLI